SIRARSSSTRKTSAAASRGAIRVPSCQGGATHRSGERGAYERVPKFVSRRLELRQEARLLGVAVDRKQQACRQQILKDQHVADGLARRTWPTAEMQA